MGNFIRVLSDGYDKINLWILILRLTNNGKKNGNGTNEPLEKQLWKTADKLRKNIVAAEYKHVVLGLIFLYRK